jgi:hypothetical protein
MSTRAVCLRSILLALLISSGLLIGGICEVSARARYNTEDLRESQKVAEQFLQHLSDENYDAAYQLGASRFRSLITLQNLRTDVEAVQQGGVVQSWRLKTYRTVEGAPRYMFLLYHVEGSKTTGDWEFTMELTQNPYQWRIGSVSGIGDSRADRDAQAARITAEQFLRCLKQHAYQIANRLFSPKGKRTYTQSLRNLWEEKEKRKGVLADWTLRSYGDAPAAISGDRQEYVVLVYRARHSQAEGEAVFTMVRIGTQWLVDNVEFRDVPPESTP